MKCAVIYLSGTGNTEIIAKEIHKGVVEANGSCDLFKFKEVNQHTFINYDLVGFGTALYGFTGPQVVKEFVKDLRLVGGKHIFVFSTHGTYGELFFPDIVPRLQGRGMVVIGTYDCFAPCYGSGYPDPYPTAGHPDEIDLREAREFGKKMVANSLKIAAGDTSLIPPVPVALKLDIGPPPGMGEGPPPDMGEGPPPDVGEGPPPGAGKGPPESQGDHILYHQEMCNYPKCRLCMDNCPSDGIDLTVTPPAIADPCIGCAEMCAKVCPTGAMEVNPDHLEASAKFHRDSLSFLYYPALELTENTGHFRRLLSVEEVGEDTPFYMKHTKHPQWIVGKGPVYD
jgi:flavodoxin/NAD-dependent dihydropyrimidine dehydrogenase PreA subunit